MIRNDIMTSYLHSDVIVCDYVCCYVTSSTGYKKYNNNNDTSFCWKNAIKFKL